MKIFAGKLKLWALMLVCLWAVVGTVDARITVEADRTDIAMGETLRLTLTANEGERPDEIDLTQLERDFEILQRSSATSARIVGGEQNVTRTLELELAPKRDGLLAIPALNYSGRRTTPVAIKVGPQSDTVLGNELVYFDASVNKDEAYVQAQIILTITLQQAINLDNRAISDLDIPNTYTEALEQKTYQRRVGGRLWQVTELRYALFPQQSGNLTIPSISFSGRELLPGRSLLGARLGRRIALQTQPIEITVNAVPADFPGDVWLPAENIALTSTWSSAPDRLTIGDSSTRTIEMTARGLQGSQLPPINSLMDGAIRPGLKFYPDQETIQQREVPSGIEGYRLQSEALVATTSGSWSLPEVTIPWWNTNTDTLEYARLPAVQINIGAPTVTSVLDAPSSVVADFGRESGPQPLLWPWQLTAAAGWCLAGLLGGLLWRTRGRTGSSQLNTKPHAANNRSLVSLRLACNSNDPAAARDALLAWANHRAQPMTVMSLDALAKTCSPALAQEVRRLDASLWGKDAQSWQGDKLFSLVKGEDGPARALAGETLTLYPS